MGKLKRSLWCSKTVAGEGDYSEYTWKVWWHCTHTCKCGRSFWCSKMMTGFFLLGYRSTRELPCVLLHGDRLYSARLWMLALVRKYADVLLGRDGLCDGQFLLLELQYGHFRLSDLLCELADVCLGGNGLCDVWFLLPELLQTQIQCAGLLVCSLVGMGCAMARFF